MVSVITRSCPTPIWPEASAAAVAGSSGCKVSPVNVRRVPTSDACRLACVRRQQTAGASGQEPGSTSKPPAAGDLACLQLCDQFEHDRIRVAGQCLDVPQCLGNTLIIKGVELFPRNVESPGYRLRGLAQRNRHTPIVA
jgi:hypothetical protein